MLPAIFSGLRLAIEPYDQLEEFPIERDQLDDIAIGCGAEFDPFFLTPLKSVELTVPEDTDPQLGRCLSYGLQGLGLTTSQNNS